MSIHDVTPANEELVERALTAAERWGLGKPALLVIPNHHGVWPIETYPRFVDRLAVLERSGCEVLLHGYVHLASEDHHQHSPLVRLKSRLLTAGEGEFQNLSFAMARARIQRGRERLQHCLGVRPTGFVAPAWLENIEVSAALRASGFAYHEDHLYIEDIVAKRRHFAPAITFSARSRIRACMSRGWARLMRNLTANIDVRLALHPADFSNRTLVSAIALLVSNLQRTHRMTRYDDFLARINPVSSSS